MKHINDIRKKHRWVNHNRYLIHETKIFIMLTHESSSDPIVESRHLFVFILRNMHSMLYNSLCSFWVQKESPLQFTGRSIYRTKSTLRCPWLFALSTVDILCDLRDFCDLRPQILMGPATLWLLRPTTSLLLRPATCAFSLVKEATVWLRGPVRLLVANLWGTFAMLGNLQQSELPREYLLSVYGSIQEHPGSRCTF